jgi:hypothetical protein
MYLAASWEYATSPVDSRRNAEKAVRYVELARKMLADHWKDACHFRALAAAKAEAGDFEQAVAAETKAHALYSDADSSKWGHLLELYRSGQPYREPQQTVH